MMKPAIMVRIAVPVLLGAGFILYRVFDRSYPYGEAVRWPGVLAWILAALLVLGYHIQNKNRPRTLLAITAIAAALSILSFVYALYGASGFDGITWAAVVSLPLAVLAGLLLLISLYVGPK